MCELLGMSANVPTDICFSFAGLLRRGGDTGPHRDGWGVAFYEQDGCRCFHDPEPSAQSPLAELIRAWPIKSKVVISHIRQANVGVVALQNTQPYQRELWGRPWTYAHNGQIPDVMKRDLQFYTPIGTTDSEHAFCWLLGELRAAFDERPNDDELAAFLKPRCDELAAMGVFNMLLSEGGRLISYCATKLQWITRCAPFGTATLDDDDLSVDFANLTGSDDVVTIIATTPLTGDENWHPMVSGELAVFVDGERRAVLGAQ